MLTARMIGLLPIAFVLVSCEGESSTCIDIPRWALNVEVLDSLTGDPAAFGATLVLRKEGYTDSVAVEPPFFQPTARLVQLGFNADPGVHTLSVDKGGFKNWENEIAVDGSACGAITRTTTVLLVPE